MKKKIILVIVICFIAAMGMIHLLNPIAFAKDGLLTRKEVDCFDTSYELGVTRRHEEEVDQIYLLCIQREAPVVRLEKNGEETAVELMKAGPFLYYWEWDVSDGQAYQVQTQAKKYYFTIVVT